MDKIRNLNLPPLDMETIHKNAQEFSRNKGKIKDKGWNGQLGEKENKVVVLIADAYATHLNQLRKRKSLEQQDLKGVVVSRAYLRKMLKCSKTDLKKRLLRLESTGALKIEDDGNEGIRVWPSLFPIFKDPESFEDYINQLKTNDNITRQNS